MSSVPYVISDLHLGHKRILEFTSPYRSGITVDEHDEWIIQQWNSRVRKRDVVYVLGDVAFSHEGLAKCALLNGQKMLVMGNHDQFHIDDYRKHFSIKPGIFKYKGFWLSHAPIHPAELRGHFNIHGHVHQHTIDDGRYINACVEAVNGVPLNVEELRERFQGVKSVA